ncbi:unnamed protein product [Spirodela intermedia]|uniref:Uncharacterized protein n=1 Tax=Spirodela intermedia TaxID=51605 RepID=A0A7I8KFK0_SPIIN|nr:unnamed protein product [Spirodela intermedia]
MEALFRRFSSMGEEAMRDRAFDTARIDELVAQFAAEARRSGEAMEEELRRATGGAAAFLREMEGELSSLLDAAAGGHRPAGRGRKKRV